MKRVKTTAAFALIFIIAVLFTGCSSVMNKMENEEVRAYTETMVDSIIDGDVDTAYSLLQDACTIDEFTPVFKNLEILLKDVESYELKLIGLYNNTNINNGKSVTTLSTTYKMTDNADKIYVISANSSSECEKLSYFEIQPYKNTKLYSTGTINSMKDASTLQWIMMLLNIPILGIVVFAVIDCSRQKINKKALWLVLIVLGLVTFGLSLSSSNIRLNLNLGLFLNYSAFIKYGDGSMILRSMLPVGAIVYFIMRNHLIKKASNPPQPPMTPQPQQYMPYNSPYQPIYHDTQQYGNQQSQENFTQEQAPYSQSQNTDVN